MIPARVHIGTHRYVIDLAQMVRRPLASIRQAVDQGLEAGEQSLDNSALWKRTCSDFILGQGQRYFDQEDEASRRRFRASRGFDPLGSRRALTNAYTLSSETTVASGSNAGRNRLVRTDANVWIGSPGQLTRTASLSSFSLTTITGGPGVSLFEDFTFFAGQVYVAYGASGVYRGTSTGSTVASFSAVVTKVISAELGRLVCGNGATLFELSSAGVSIPIFTHPNTNWNWTAFSAGNAGVYVSGHDGLRGEIYLLTVIDATGVFAPPIPVAQLPAGEQIRAMSYFGGFLVICTTKGVRIAQAAQSGLLSYGPLIDLGDTYDVSFEGRFAYVTCTSVPDFTGVPGVVALSLDRFTAPLTPAYATVSYYAGAVTSEKAVAVSTLGADLALLLSSDSLSNTRITSTVSHLYGTAEYWSGQVTYGTPEPKSVQSVEVIFDALTNRQTVVAELWDFKGGTRYATATVAQVGATSVILEPSSEMLTETLEVFLSATIATPVDAGFVPVVFRRWTARAVVAPRYLPEEIILPLMLSREVLNEDGSMTQLDPEAEWIYLAGLMRARTRVEVQFGNDLVDAWVDQVGVEGGWTRWDERGQWPEGLVLVRLVTVGQSA